MRNYIYMQTLQTCLHKQTNLPVRAPIDTSAKIVRACVCKHLPQSIRSHMHNWKFKVLSFCVLIKHKTKNTLQLPCTEYPSIIPHNNPSSRMSSNPFSHVITSPIIVTIHPNDKSSIPSLRDTSCLCGYFLPCYVYNMCTTR